MVEKLHNELLEWTSCSGLVGDMVPALTDFGLNNGGRIDDFHMMLSTRKQHGMFADMVCKNYQSQTVTKKSKCYGSKLMGSRMGSRSNKRKDS